MQHYCYIQASESLRRYVQGFYFADKAVESLDIQAPPTGYPLLGYIWKGFAGATINGSTIPGPPLLPMNHFSGQLNSYAKVHWKGHIGHLLAEFTATGLYEMFALQGQTIVNSTVPVASVIPDFDKLMSYELSTSEFAEGYKDALERALIIQSENAIEAPDFVIEAVRQIEIAQGDVRLHELISRLEVSERTFRQQFQKVVGVTPKHFSRAVQFNHIVQIVMNEESVSLSQLAQESGFYDQAHFCKAVKAHILSSPTEFFESDFSRISSFIRQNYATPSKI